MPKSNSTSYSKSKVVVMVASSAGIDEEIAPALRRLTRRRLQQNHAE